MRAMRNLTAAAIAPFAALVLSLVPIGAADVPAAAAAPVVLQPESFALSKATIAPIPDTTRRGILMGTEDATATASLRLAPGKYAVVVHLYGSDEAHDGLYVDIGAEEFRVFAATLGAVTPHSRSGIDEGEPHELPLTVANKEPISLVLRTKETDVIIDHVVITPVAK